MITSQRNPKIITQGTARYPLLKEFTDEEGNYIVLFTEPGTGMVVFSNQPTVPIGDISGYTSDEHWSEEDFILYQGDVKLENAKGA